MDLPDVLSSRVSPLLQDGHMHSLAALIGLECLALNQLAHVTGAALAALVGLQGLTRLVLSGGLNGNIVRGEHIKVCVYWLVGGWWL